MAPTSQYKKEATMCLIHFSEALKTVWVSSATLTHYLRQSLYSAVSINLTTESYSKLFYYKFQKQKFMVH